MISHAQNAYPQGCPYSLAPEKSLLIHCTEATCVYWSVSSAKRKCTCLFLGRKIYLPQKTRVRAHTHTHSITVHTRAHTHSTTLHTRAHVHTHTQHHSCAHTHTHTHTSIIVAHTHTHTHTASQRRPHTHTHSTTVPMVNCQHGLTWARES